jgi:general secretion pathway protein C
MAIDTILKRYFPSLVLTLIAVAAYFQARGLTELLANALGDHARQSTVSPPREGVSPEADRKSGQAILERNPFDSVTGPFPGTPGLAGVPSSNAFDVSDPLSWPSCEGVQVLIVTQSTDPWWSLATVQGPDEPRPRSRRVGDGVAGKQVAFIGYNRKQQTPAVWLEGGGAVCQSTLFGAPPRAPVAREADRAPATGSFTSALRVVPERKDGKLVGLRLFGIRPQTLLGTLGLRNGDRLESINGFDVGSPEKALEAYARLRSATHLRVQVNRVGKPVELNFHII